MLKIVKKPNKKEVTTILGKDVHKIIEKYSDKKKYREYRRLWSKAAQLKFVPNYPLQIDFELNYSCNFSCEMCTWSVESAKNRGKNTWLSFETFKEIVDDGVKRGLKAIRLNYINEPLIRNDIIKFITYAKEVGVLDIYLSTNGSLLKGKVAEEIIRSGLTRLQVSIDAYTEDTFNKIRQGGDFKEVVQNTLNFINLKKKLKKELPTVRVNFVKTAINKHEYESFVNFWSKRADCIGIQDLVNIMRPSKDAKVKKFNCAQPFYHLTVRYDGSILPCCTFFAAKLPFARIETSSHLSNEKNLHNNNISDLPIKNISQSWNDNAINELREIHKQGRYYDNPVCKECVNSLNNYDETT